MTSVKRFRFESGPFLMEVTGVTGGGIARLDGAGEHFKDIRADESAAQGHLSQGSFANLGSQNMNAGPVSLTLSGFSRPLIFATLAIPADHSRLPLNSALCPGSSWWSERRHDRVAAGFARGPRRTRGRAGHRFSGDHAVQDPKLEIPRILPHNSPHCVFRKSLRVDGTALVTERKTGPDSRAAAEIHWSRSSLTQAGIGTVRTRSPLPIRSGSTQRPERCWMSLICSRASSARRSAQPMRSPRTARSRRLSFPPR